MTSPITFQPNPVRGGRMTLNEPLTGEQIESLYLDWLITEHPGRTGEVKFDKDNNLLFIGYWDIDVTFDPELVTFEVDGYQETAEAQALPTVAHAEPDMAAFKAPVADVLAATPENASLNPVDVRAMLSPKPELQVARIHDKATMTAARNFAQASAIPTQGSLHEFTPTNRMSELKPNNGISEISAKPAIDRNTPRAGRVFIKNQPEQQRRPQPYSQHTTESTTMGKSHRKDDRAVKTRQEDTGRPHSRREDTFRRDSAPARASHPANQDMITKLLANGIGSARMPVDPGAYLKSVRDKQLQQRRLRDEDYVDGETCINVSSAAETPLGKMLRLTEQRHFEYPGVGAFQSLAGLYLMLTDNPCQGYSTLYGAKASKALYVNHDYRRELYGVQSLTKDEFDRGVRGHYDLRAIYAVMADALWLTTNQDANLVMALLDNELAFECYSWVRPKPNPAEKEAGIEPKLRLRHELTGTWYLPLLREVVRCLRARLRAVQAGKSGDELPVPDFTQAIDAAINRLRRRMSRELERRELGYARPPEEARPLADKPKREKKPQINEAIFGKQPEPVEPMVQAAAGQDTDLQATDEPMDFDPDELTLSDAGSDANVPLTGAITPQGDGQATIGVSTEPMGEVALTNEQLQQAQADVALAESKLQPMQVAEPPEAHPVPHEFATAPTPAPQAPVVQEFATAHNVNG